MLTCKADESLRRVEMDGFVFPLGVYPVERIKPRAGFTVEFEAGDEAADPTPREPDADWEQWPDRYVYDIVVPHDRLATLARQLIAIAPARIYPILDFLGHDAFREIDPYIAYDPVSLERFIDGYRRFRTFFIEDGMVGWGFMTEEPFFYVFIDEHKILTVRCEPDLRDTIDKLLEAFELQEIDEPAGADAAAHEHRTVLVAPQDEPELLTPEEIVEHLQDLWDLSLNIDAESNLDDGGKELGITVWRCILRVDRNEQRTQTSYAELFLRAACLREADEIAHQAAAELLGNDGWIDAVVVSADRLTDQTAAQHLKSIPDLTRVPKAPKSGKTGVLGARWLGQPQGADPTNDGDKPGGENGATT